MNFPKIPITSITADINAELKSLIKTSSFNDEDIYSWAVDAARQIYDSVYGTEEVYLTVTKHTATLPKSFYLLDEIWLCEDGTLAYTKDGNAPTGLKWIRSRIIQPADSMTLRYCTKNCVKPNTTDVSLSYSLKIPPGIARFSFYSGTVYMKVLVMEHDKEGVVLVKDEINSIIAIKNYVKMMLLEEKFIGGDIPQSVYMVFKDSWETYFGNAQRVLKFPDLADGEFLAVQQDQRFRKFRYRNQ